MSTARTGMQALLLGLTCIVAACGGAPEATTGGVAASAPAIPTQGAVAPSSAVPAATAAPTAEPAPTATPAPTWADWQVPDGRTATVLVIGADDTTYLEMFTVGANGERGEVQLVALDASGAPRADWTGPAIPADHVVSAALAADDGSVYLTIGPDPHAQKEIPQSVVVYRLAPDGTVVEGWPVTIEGDYLASAPVLVGNDIAFVHRRSREASTVERLAADGASVPGWPLDLQMSAFVGPLPRTWDGPLYVSVHSYSEGITTVNAESITAYGPDGSPVPGWQQPATKKGRFAYLAPAGDGLLLFQVGEWMTTNPTTVTPLRADGLASGDAVKAAGTGGLSTYPGVAGDGVVYVAYGSGGWSPADGKVVDARPGLVVAYGPDARPLPGWPVKTEDFPVNGLGTAPLPVAPDGSIWIIERANGTAFLIHHLGVDGEEIGEAVPGDADIYQVGAVAPDGSLVTTLMGDGVTMVTRVPAR